MSEKDYQAIARAIYATTHGLTESQWRDVAEPIRSAIADALAADNSAFDRARFIEACETGRVSR